MGRILSFGFLVVLGLSGCSHAPLRKTPPRQALSEICSVGMKVRKAQGATWMKVSSDDARGQFPANVLVQDPQQLDLEITNLLGGTEATVTVRGDKYRVVKGGKESRSWQGTGTWGGIPLRWASELFLGRFPCPAPQEQAKARVSIEGDDQLRVDVGSETYVYSVKEWSGKMWAFELEWMTKGSPGGDLKFEFAEPEDVTGSPLDWTAKSSKGEVRVRWKKGQRETVGRS